MKKILFLFLLTLFTLLLVVAGEYTKPNVTSKCGLQVNTYTGNLFLHRTDLHIPARGLDLDVVFSYNSGETKYDYGYGGGWTHSFNVVYEKIDTNISVKTWDGNRLLFTFNGVVYVPPLGCYDSLTRYAEGKFRLRTKHGVEFFFDDSTHKKVTSICDRNGNTVTITYSGGNPTLIIDANGRSISLTWTSGRMTQLSDFASPVRIITYSYDTQGNLVRVTDPLGNKIRYDYDYAKRLIIVTNPTSTHFYVTYNDSGAVTQIKSSLSDESFSYDKGSKITTHTIGGNTTTYTFDMSARVTEIAGACCGYLRQFQYDSYNNITSMTNANGKTTSYTYDSRGNKLTEKNAHNKTTTYTYEPVYNMVTSVTDKLLNTTTFTYDAKGNCSDVSKPLGITEHFTYDSYGNVTSYTDGLTNTTSFTYDGNGYRTGITHPIGGESFTYDNVGNMLTHNDANVNTTTNTYDALARLISTQNALSEVTSYTYDVNGNMVSATYPNGNVINYTYDALDRVTQMTDGFGTLQANTYDAAGNLLSSTDGNGNITTYSYDSQNRLTSKARGGVSESYTYDAVGNVLTKTDGNGHTTTYTYDGLNRVYTITTGGVEIANMYDANSNVIGRTDGNNNETSYEYDALNRLTLEELDDNSTTQYTYDANGNVVSRTDNNGAVTTYTYDANNRLTKRDFPGSNDDIYTYDAGGRMLTANNADATISFTYNTANRLLTEVLNGHTTSYSYNIPARQRTISYPGVTIVQETRNQRGNLVSLTDGGVNASYSYDLGGRLSTIDYSNGLSTEHGYNSRDLVASIVHSRYGITMDSVGYRYDNADNLEVLINGSRSEMYGYNDLNWLTSFKRGILVGSDIPSPTYNSIYSYDNASNRTSVIQNGTTTTYTSNYLNQYELTSPGGTFSYDLNGNMTASSTFGGSYDYQNRLLSGIDSTTSAEVFFKYDALGRRIQKQVTIDGGVTFDAINYYYAGKRVIEERNNADIVTATYAWGNRWIDILRSAGSTFFQLKNALGSVAAMTDSAGIVVERYEYDPFGTPIIWDPSYTTQRHASLVGNRNMFKGKEWNGEIGKYNLRSRFYSPDLGRFLQRGPRTMGVYPAEYEGSSYGTPSEIEWDFGNGYSEKQSYGVYPAEFEGSSYGVPSEFEWDFGDGYAGKQSYGVYPAEYEGGSYGTPSEFEWDFGEGRTAYASYSYYKCGDHLCESNSFCCYDEGSKSYYCSKSPCPWEGNSWEYNLNNY